MRHMDLNHSGRLHGACLRVIHCASFVRCATRSSDVDADGEPRRQGWDAMLHNAFQGAMWRWGERVRWTVPPPRSMDLLAVGEEDDAEEWSGENEIYGNGKWSSRWLGMVKTGYRADERTMRIVNRDGNLGTGTRPDRYGYEDNFLPAGGTCTRIRPKLRRVRNRYFFPPVSNPMDTRYFTTAIILRCEQVKICSFCYINYDLFRLLNFIT
jgi:hypothetical protein